MPSTFCRLTSFLRITPDLYLAGVQKGGTTSLYSWLIQHPQIIPAKNKEIFYYSITGNYHKGDQYYRQFFATKLYKRIHEFNIKKRAITLDATSNTFDSLEAPARILKDNPKARVIVLLRDPVARAFSHYKFSVKKGFEKATFEKALELEDKRISLAKENPLADPGHNYVRQRLGYFNRGLYADHAKNWLNIFPTSQLLFVNSETLFKESSRTFNEITDFLGLDRYDGIKFQKWNEGSKEKMNDGTRQSLVERYKSHNERLFQIINQRYDW